jgi:ubiquinone/menaquinone biosynthesis C-methylase UbiE
VWAWLRPGGGGRGAAIGAGGPHDASGPAHPVLTRFVGQVYSRGAGRYDAVITRGVVRLMVPPAGDRTIAAWVLAHRPEPPVLDIPAGTGVYLKDLPDLAVGADLADGMLRVAQSRLPGVPLVQADAFTLPFRADAFGTVLTALGLHVIPAPAGVIPELARVLRPGGQLLGVVPLISPYVATPARLRHLLDIPELVLEELECRRLVAFFRARRRDVRVTRSTNPSDGS